MQDRNVAPGRREWLLRAGASVLAGVGAAANVVSSASLFASAPGAAGAEPAAPCCGSDEPGANAAPPASIAATSSAVQFGFSLYGMRSLPVCEALKKCAEIGYDAVELVANDGWPCDPKSLPTDARKAIRDRLVDLNLGLASVMENLGALTDESGHRKNLDRLAAAAALGRELSAAVPPVVETILGGKPDQWDSVRDRFAAALTDWAKIAERERVVVAIKPHVAGAVHTPEGAVWLMERVGGPWLRLAYDFSHYRLRGLDMAETLRTLMPHTAFVHIKDAKGTAADFQFLLPGEGDVDYAALFQHLAQAKWRGAVMVEVSGQLFSKPGYDPLRAARRSYEAVSPAFEKAGLIRAKAARAGR